MTIQLTCVTIKVTVYELIKHNKIKEEVVKMHYSQTSEILIPFYNFTEEDLFILTAGYTNFSHIAESFTEYRIHTFYSLSFVVNGEGNLYIGKKHYKIKKGDIFILPKGVKVKYYPKEPKSWEYFWFDFNGTKCEEYLKLMGFSKDKYVIQPGNINDIIYLCEPVISKKIKGENIGYYEVVAAFFNILDTIIKSKSDAYAPANLKDSVEKYIKLHYSRASLTIEELCRDFNISHSYLCKLFKNKDGLTAKGTITKIRLNEAKKLLLNPNFSIKQIAHSVGFSDDAYFMKIFKNKQNSPSTNDTSIENNQN